MAKGQQALCLLLCVALTAVHADVSKGDKDTINKGLEAGKDFAEALSKPGFKAFTDSLRKMNDIIGPWVDGIGIFSSVLGLFLPEDNAILSEMRRGFKEVNARLDDIREGLDEVKKAIDWAVIKINLQPLEQSIRSLNLELAAAVAAPNADHGKAEFIRVYEQDYHKAGTILYDAIVNLDQIFYENIIKAGMKYTEYRRSMMDGYLRGLISLMMNAANIEIAYESFKEHDRGVAKLWKTRLTKVKETMQEADRILEDAWQTLFRGEVDKMAKDKQGLSMESFRNAVWSFLSNKYSWCHWFVLVYDPVTGGDKHGVMAITKYSHTKFRFYGRNYIIGVSFPDITFDAAAAEATVRRDVECPHEQRICERESAFRLVQEVPKHGMLVAAIQYNKASFSVMFPKRRAAWNRMTYTKQPWWTRIHYQFQFG